MSLMNLIPLTTTKTRWRRLIEATPAPLDDEHLYLSSNGKTGLSLNVSIAKTCRPTKACRTYCYGLEGRITMPAALARQADNAAVFDRLVDASEEEVEAEARLLAEEVLCHQNFLRVFGVGDLQPGSVRFIAALARVAPTLSLWVSTRRPDLAAKLLLDLSTGKEQVIHKDVYEVNRNVHVMLSLDATTTAKNAQASRALVRRGKGMVYLAWMQQSPSEKIPKDVTVVFAEHHTGKGWAPWTVYAADPRTCPATLQNGTPHEDACASCRFCFSLATRRSAPRPPRRITKRSF